jgi:outer membrane lipoprotein SlyB
MSSSLETLFPTLFPIFIMIATIIVALYYLYLKKVEANAPVKAKEPRPTQPAVSFVGVETGKPHAPVDTVEGFQSSVGGFPVWSGPSTRFALSVNDRYYKEYANNNLVPSAEILALMNSIQVTDKRVTSYGSMLTNFDADINRIPWDADNAQYVQKDVVWGYVSQSASNSIFLKAYHRKLLSDVENLIESETSLEYRSPILQVNARDPASSAALQLFDGMATAIGQEVLDVSAKKIIGVIQNNAISAVQSKMERENGRFSIKNIDSLSWIERKALNDISLSEDRNTARQAKVNAGLELTSAEKVQQQIYNSAQTDPDKKGKFSGGTVEKSLKKISAVDNITIGVKKARKLALGEFQKKFQAKLGKVLGARIAAMIARLTVFKVITAVIWGMNAAVTAGAVLTAGILAPFAVITNLLVVLWTSLDVVATVAVIAIQAILPAIMERAFKNGSLCAEGKPLDILIENEFLYFIFATFCPIGSVLDAFGPYTCYKSDGAITFKSPLYIPPYFADSSLSVSKHTFPLNKTPRGDSTRYKSNLESLGPEWKLTAGIARKDCAPGTWTSSDVDMLCNISTYVPETYPKKTSIPERRIKESYVPATIPKLSEPMTYGRSTYTIGAGVPFVLDDCPAGYETHALTCFKAAKTTCTGDWRRPVWVEGHQKCETDWGGTIGRLNSKTCPSGKEEKDLLCYDICREGYSRVPGLPYVCAEACKTGDNEVGTLLCKKQACPTGYDNVADICWQQCSPTQHNVGALCRNHCVANEEEEVGAVCYDKCNADEHDDGLICRKHCGGDTPEDVAGVCWGSCGNDRPLGALCRKYCKDGFHEVAGVCWGNTQTYARESKIPKSEKIYDPGYNPPDISYETAATILDETRLEFPYCNYASPTMLNRMAQFYYDQSILNATMLDDGRIQYEYIVMFYGVIASSELSCDVACAMKTVKFNPITGDNYDESLGTLYPEDPGNTVSYRRFYFYKELNDTSEGLFTVSGCTNKDYTAPDAQNKSTDPDVDPIISVPKTFEVKNKRVKPGTWNMDDFTKSVATVAVATTAGLVGAQLGGKAGPTGAIIGGTVGGVAGGMASQAVNNAMTKVIANDPGANVENTVIGNRTSGYFVATNNDNFSINMGPVYEVKARDGTGYIPVFNFCTKVITTPSLCANELVLRDTVDLYHTNNPTKRIKTVSEIEPRGKDGCYYKWSTTSYSAATNIEGNVINTEEVIRKFIITDNSTCVYTPTNIFTTTTNYPIRSYTDINGEIVYPTRNVLLKATFQARFIHIRPSQNNTAEKTMQLSQVAVYDETGTNIAVGKSPYANSTFSGTAANMTAPISKVIDGNLTSLVGASDNYRNAGNSTDFIEIDLGRNYYISNVVLYGRVDNTNVSQNLGIRIQLLYNRTDTPIKELTTITSDMINNVDFRTKTLTIKTPNTPFNVPNPLPPETRLGTNCPTRCQDKPQIDSFIEQYNATDASRQIINVLKAVTPSNTRCDYEVEMVRVVGDKKVVAKELISMTATLATTTSNQGTVYGRFIRVRPPLTSGDGHLNISQIIVTDALGNNLALNRPVFGTSRHRNSAGTISAAPSIVTDGKLFARASPTGTWQSATTNRNDEFLEIDLGITKPIVSITYYGSTNTSVERNLGVRIQILPLNDINTIPSSESVLTTNNNFQTIQFNKCTFTYSVPSSVSGSFIQENTPHLNSVDTSGGILTFKNIGTSVMNIFNSIINPIKTQNPLGVLNTHVKAAETTASNTLNAVAENQILQTGCPERKCSDPAVLNAIIERYNDDKKLTLDYGGESNKIVQIAKAGVAGPNTCDVLFTNLYELYDDALYPPVYTENTTVAKRFKMTNTGNCVMAVAPGNTSIIDITSDAIGIVPRSSSLTTPYSPQCKLNCRNESILTNVKQKLNTQYQTPTVFPNFNTVVQSYQKEASVCEYMFKKDVSRKNVTTNRMSTETGLDTYVNAAFTIDNSTCAASLKTVTEYDPDLITTTRDSVTGFVNSFINGAEVFLPWLFNYDNTQPSSRVDETVKILS